MDHSTSAGEEEPAAEGAGSDVTLETTRTGAWSTDHELEGATCLGTRANCAVNPASPKGLYLHQQRELRNLGLLTSPMVSKAEVAREKEHTMESPQMTKWKETTSKEMDGLQKHAVFKLVSPDSIPPEHKAIGTKWVFKVKADHTLEGRVEVEGWGQVSGIDCGCTNLLVYRFQNICLALTIAASEDWEALQLDVQTAFLIVEVQEVYVRIPPGYKPLGDTTGRPIVVKPKKSPYGLCQSPRNWFNTIDDLLKNIGFTATASDPCVSMFGSDNNLSVSTMYVGDLLLLGGDTTLLKDLKIQLMD